MHCHALPAARTGLSSGPAPTLRSGSPPTPPTYARSQPTICPPQGSSSLEPPEEHGHISRISTGGWSHNRSACSSRRTGRHPRRGGHPVAPQLSWTILVVSWQLGASRHRRSLPIGIGCSDEVGSLAGASREAVSMPPPRLQLPAPSPRRTPGIGKNEHLCCPLGEKGEAFQTKGTLDTPLPLPWRGRPRPVSPAKAHHGASV